jgi:hypothetical protein
LYTSWFNPITVSMALAAVLIACSWFKPHIARIVLGVFFLIMALGINLPLSLSAPGWYVELGGHSVVPFYRWAFSELVAWNPRLFVLPIVLYQSAVGGLILSSGRSVRLGLLGGILFCLAITPAGVEEYTAPAIALALALLLRIEFSKSLWVRLKGSFDRFYPLGKV